MPSSKYLIAAVVILAVFAVLGFVLMDRTVEVPEIKTTEPIVVATTTEKIVVSPRKTIGASVKGRAIEAHTYGTGTTHLLFVGGVHGGYEWNSVILAYEFIDYLEAHPDVVAAHMKITVIPSLNPDGVYAVVGREGRFTALQVPKTENTAGLGRFNAHEVDLNRNFDCNWQPKSMWKDRTVSAGTAPFSEPESLALRDFVLAQKPKAVIFWHSKSNAVYASECNKGILPDTLAIMNVYAKASGYTPIKSFDAYAITGDAEGWLASMQIPAITVELKTHESVEWERNLAGIRALLGYYPQKK